MNIKLFVSFEIVGTGQRAYCHIVGGVNVFMVPYNFYVFV